jgi:anthranilate synthase/aminodeoxychorismate synthase-like glutamine amidotransferase
MRHGMILLIDNYDSFVYNLARYVSELGCITRVVRNDAVSVAEIERWRPEAIILSPGPCTPHESGICLELIRQLGPHVPMLGVCLGHQAIAAACGGTVVRAPQPVHGRTSLITHGATGLFAGLPNPWRATRYHSLIVREEGLPRDLRIVARSEDGLSMALEHCRWPLYGVQFHPESVLTAGGHQLLQNFLQLAGIEARGCPRGDLQEPPLDDSWYAQSATFARPLPF